MQQASRSADDVIHVLGNEQEGFGEVTGRLTLRLALVSYIRNILDD